MFVDANKKEDIETLYADICIIGSGPGGITLALELGTTGCEIVLLESGGINKALEATSSFKAEILSSNHSPLNEAVNRQFGGTSVIWGGRCVPYDPIDFEDRDYVPEARWPISYSDVEKYYSKASEYACCEPAEFSIKNLPPGTLNSIVPGLNESKEIRGSTLERWGLPTDFGKEYRTTIRKSKNIYLIFNAICSEILFDDFERAKSVLFKNKNGKTYEIAAKIIVVAAGGVETTRLLLNSDSMHPNGVGNHSDNLGRYYMGHISGKIANIHFSTPPKKTVYGFDRDDNGVYCRRRFSFSRDFLQKNRLMNFVAWLDNPPIYNPDHRNGILSLAYLALRSSILGKRLVPAGIRNIFLKTNIEENTAAHIKNILVDFPQVIKFCIPFFCKRFFARRKIPGFFLYIKNNVYSLHYHSEHAPSKNSKITLSDERDQYGLRKVVVDFKYKAIDVDTVLRAHDYIDGILRKEGCGYLEYVSDNPESDVWSQASDGFHQIGTTRMSIDPKEGVVDENCRVHGIDNLFVASSSVFVTSSQANPTLTIIAFSIRLADYIKSNWRKL